MAFFQNAQRIRLLATAAPLGLLLAANPAMAQDKPTDAAPATSDQSADTTQPADDIVVTGTLFTNKLTTSASPVTVVTSENLARAGVTNVSDAIRSVSADGAGSIGNGFSSGFSAGGSAVSLRNLGVSSTITLVDGMRSANFPLNDDGHNNYVDLNSIPMANIESIQVLKDGASATYGADAIGGVVNLVTRKSFKGFEATVDGGASQRGEFGKYRGRLLVGFGDYSSQGFNVYVGGDYERNAMVTNASLGFPFNTLDLRSIGGNDNNRADDTLTTATPNAVVTRTTQTDLNNPLAGSVANATTPAIFNSLTPLANCPYGTYSENTSQRIGTACAHDLQKEYAIFLPFQERYDVVGRASFRLGSSIEGYLAGSYAHNRVEISRAPIAVRQTQAFGGSPSTSTSAPGIVLPVYICSSGVNCATAADRQLNPNNPYAAAYAANPAAGAARLYYLFGDIKSGSKRINEVYRISGGLKGDIGSNWNWNLSSAYSRDNLDLTVYGNFNLNGLIKAINTGAYNFVNPSLNSQAVRDMVAPAINAKSDSTEFTVDGTVAGTLLALPGGDMQLAVGGQFRREELNNRSINPNLDLPGVSTAQAFGKRSVVAGFFELDAPILDMLDIKISGRYDHYSTGIGRFSPKAGFTFEPIKGFSLRGTYSEGFRAPTFAESDSRSSFSGFVGFDPTTVPAFIAAHPGNAGYTATYSLGRGFVGNPNIKPEISRSFTLGAIIDPVRWLTFTADYYHVKKSNLIVTGPLVADAINAYYSVAGQSFNSAAAAAAAGCAKVAAIGQGYSCNVIDGADPSNLNSLPRLLVLNAPYVNSAYLISSGLEFSLDARIPISAGVRFESRLDLQETLQYDLHPVNGAVQKYAGTVGPEDLSSGGGTPRWRGNWQNSLVAGPFTLTATTYYVGRIKAVAADQASSPNGDISCNAAVYKVKGQPVDKFCYVHSFIYTDLNLATKVNDQFTFSLTVGNVFGARAPLFANTAYTTQTNYLASWHAAGLIGRTFRAGATFKF